jgi:hypothetical protein
MRKRINFINIFLEVASALYSTLVSVWLGWTIGSRTNLRKVQKTHPVKHVQSADPLRPASLSPCRSTSDIIICLTLSIGLNLKVLPKHGRFLLKHPVY